MAASQERDPDLDGPDPLDERYVHINVDDAEVVVYDSKNETAWVQSDLTIPIGGAN